MCNFPARGLLALLATFVPVAALADAALLLRPAQVWSAGEPVHAGWTVLVQAERIVAVGPASTVHAPADAEVIDLPGATLLPGLMDLHSHLFLHPYNEARWDEQVLKEPVPYRTLRAGVQARATLQAGFTTLRDLGTEGAEYADVALKRAIEERLIEGPRLFVATRAIVATASYGPAPRSLRPDVCCTPQGAEEASGIPEVIRAVREQAGRGADWIKVYADYRWGPDGTQQPTFSEEELQALVSTAHSSGRPVAAHAVTAEGMRRAAVAGVETIEHGYGGTAETFRLMAAHQVAYLPTLTAEAAYSEYFEHYVPGVSEPTAAHAPGRPGVPAGAQGGRADWLRERRGRVRPRHQLPRAGVDGEGRHDARAGADRGHCHRRAHPAPRGGSWPHPPRDAGGSDRSTR